jgi:hypothetical protein
MNPPIKNRTHQWLWFIGLWCGGLFTALAVGYTIKFLIKLI